MLRRLSIGLLSALIAQQVASAQQNPSDALNAAAEAAAAAFDNPNQPPPGEPLPAPVGDFQTNAAVDAAAAAVPGDGEILLTGPLHEAYAEQFTAKAIPGLIVGKRPPDPINEVPPEYRPDGSDVAWIPGYWGWDLDRDDFVWVTGIWRQTPPNHVWIPGYWAEVPEGYQWISGFWAPSDIQEVAYLPAPPEPVDAAPSSDPPGDNYFWVPGQWTWIDNDYQWRAGYWAVAYPDWVWVPERYVYTPNGYIYRTGYWDYLLTDRGTIFCPVYWSHPVATYRLQPTYVVNVGTSLLANLFVYPQYNHYYFGNYYSSRYLGQSIYPWVTVSQQTRLYDPLYGYYQTQHRDVAFLQRVQRMHTYYASTPNMQPPHTLAMQMRNANTLQANDMAFQAMQLQQLVNNRETPMQYVRLQPQEQQRLQRALEPAREFRKQRAQMEHKSGAVAQNQPSDDAAAARAGQIGPRDQAGRGGGRNRWRLPTDQNNMTLGAAALATGQRDGQQGRADGRARGDKAEGDTTAGKSEQPADQRARAADRRNADRPGAAADTAAQDRGQARPGQDRAELDRASQERALRAREGRIGQGQTAEQAAAGKERPGVERPGIERPGVERPGVERPGLDRPDGNLRGAGSPGTDLPGASRRSANRPDVDANRPGGDRPGPDRRGSDLPGSNLPGKNLPGNKLPDKNLPGADQGGNRFGRPGSPFDRPGGTPPGANLSRPDAPSADRPGAGRAGGLGSDPGSAQGGAPGSTPLGDRGRDNRPGPGGADRPLGDRNLPGAGRTPSSPGAGQGSIQDDMRALRDLQRRDAERRRSAPPDVRSLPQRPQPAPGSNRPDNDRGRNRNPGIVPGAGAPGAGAPGGAPAGGAARGGGRPGGDASPGRGNADRGRGNDKDKDKEKGKDKK